MKLTKELAEKLIKIQGIDIIVPSNYTELEGYAFSNTSIRSIYLPDSIVKMGYGIFMKCSQLESIRLSNSITRLMGFTFADCPLLSSIELPNSLEDILGVATFARCTSLKSIKLPKTLINIGELTFVDCSSMEILNPTQIDRDHLISLIDKYKLKLERYRLGITNAKPKLENLINSVINKAILDHKISLLNYSVKNDSKLIEEYRDIILKITNIDILELC